MVTFVHNSHRIHLVCFEIFRDALGSCAVLCFWVTSAGPALAGDCGGRFFVKWSRPDSYLLDFRACCNVSAHILRYIFANQGS